MDNAKRILQEIVILPALRPEVIPHFTRLQSKQLNIKFVGSGRTLYTSTPYKLGV